jgi:alkylated DNA repair dioxygenase AlkB
MGTATGSTAMRIREVLDSDPLPLDRLRPDAPDGHYCLDDACESSVLILRGALAASLSDTTELQTYMTDDKLVPRTPNPMNRTTNLLRKQATFGAEYAFANQKNTIVPGPSNEWPRVVSDALTLAKDIVAIKGIDTKYYSGVHCNLYPSGKAGVMPHADNEPHLIPEFPIVSCTLLAGVRKERPFDIYRPPHTKGAAPEVVAKILLGHGDVVVMQGKMQQYFLHGVAPAKKKEYENAVRINLTVRAFDPDLQRRPEVPEGHLTKKTKTPTPQCA